MSVYLAIAFGGSLGAVCRYWVSTSTYNLVGANFPFGTLMVNVSGSFVMGFLAIVLADKAHISSELRFALLVGFLGSYTTFSTFAIDALEGFNNGAFMKMAVYIVLSVFGSLMGVWMGYLGARFILR